MSCFTTKPFSLCTTSRGAPTQQHLRRGCMHSARPTRSAKEKNQAKEKDLEAKKKDLHSYGRNRTWCQTELAGMKVSLFGECARLVLAGKGGKGGMLSLKTIKLSHNLILPGISIQCLKTECYTRFCGNCVKVSEISAKSRFVVQSLSI